MSKQCLHVLKSCRKLSTVDLSIGCFEAVLSYYTHEAAAHTNFMDLDHLCSITISDIAVRQNSLRAPPPPFPPISLFLRGPLLQQHLTASQTPPHRPPSPTDCEAAAPAEITTQHPGMEQPIDGVNYPIVKNCSLSKIPTLAYLEGCGMGNWQGFFFLNTLQIWMNPKQKLKHTNSICEIQTAANTHVHAILVHPILSGFDATQLKDVQHKC